MIHRPTHRAATAAVAAFLLLAFALHGRSVAAEEPGIAKTFTIQAVDAQKRLLTLTDSGGGVETIAVGPAVQKFNELKVGDKVAVRYFEPMLASVRPADQPAPAPDPAAAGEKPAGPSLDVNASVTVTAVDVKAPSLTVQTDDGQTLKFQGGDKKIVEALKAGDKLAISYMRAVAFKIDKK